MMISRPKSVKTDLGTGLAVYYRLTGFLKQNLDLRNDYTCGMGGVMRTYGCNAHTYVHRYTHTCTHNHKNTNTCMCVNTYVCMCLCVCEYNIYIYVHI
jgi:hypothetical protein